MGLVWNDAQAIPGIQSIHIIVCNSADGDLRYWQNALDASCSHQDEQPITPHSSGSCGLQEDIPSAPQDLKIGDWCLAKYEGVKYPAVVKSIVASGPEYEVSVMHPSGGYFKYQLKLTVSIILKTTLQKKFVLQYPLEVEESLCLCFEL